MKEDPSKNSKKVQHKLPNPTTLFINAFQKSPKLTIIALFTTITIAILFSFYNMVPKIIETTALQDAELFTEAIREFRTLYASEVIQTVQNHGGIEVSHDYKDKEHAIPLPATLSMLIGESIGKSGKGGMTRLYSNYPFPWRLEKGGLQDDFAKQAWEMLSKNPDKAFYRIVIQNGHNFLRYATADLMRPACIECHNNHPQSPKKDWKVGNLRGIIEISRPIDPIVSKIQGQLTMVGTLTIFPLLFVFFLLSNILLRFQKTTSNLEIKTDEHVQKARDLSTTNEKLRKTQVQLIEAEKMGALGKLSGIVAHELRNPLNAMKSSIYYLNSKLDQENEKLHKHIGIIRRGIDASDRIITDVLSFAKIRTPEFQTTDINAEVRTALNDSQIPAGVKTHLDLDHDLPELSVDPLQLRQVFVNILSNAVEAMQGQGALHIRTRVQGNRLEISYVDNGPGMDEETQAKVFEPLFTTRKKGTGLGLAVCKSLIQRQGGKIRIKSRKGYGTTFTILLPLNNDDGGGLHG